MNLVISAYLRHPHLTSAVCQPASDKKHENVNVASVQRLYTELYKCLSTQCGKVVSSTGKILQPVIHQEDVIQSYDAVLVHVNHKLQKPTGDVALGAVPLFQESHKGSCLYEKWNGNL